MLSEVNSSFEVWQWTGRLISLAMIQQSLEFFQIKQCVSASGVWSWSGVKAEFSGFPRPIRHGLDWMLDYPGFLGVLSVSLVVSVLGLIHSHPAFAWVLLGIHILTCLRWRGTFNGGSDFMMLILLIAASCAGFSPRVSKIAIGYIAFQSISSYFIAGVEKMKKRRWWTGEALRRFIESSIYGMPGGVGFVLDRPVWVRALSWCVLFFEFSFPVVLMSPKVCIAYLTVAFCFHVANAYLLGLNRFVLCWCASYPAVYYVSRYLFR